MLTEIYIENIALITKLRLQFGKGFNVLTGETGAGKSILLDAMALILGAKADSELIRHGAEKAVVEGVFSNIPEDVYTKMQGYGIEGEELILLREISQGKSVCRINGRTFPLNVLREFGQRLLNIYGQHDFQTLAKPEKHLSIVDTLLPEIKEVKNSLSEIALQIKRIQKEMTDIQFNTQNALQEVDFLTFQAEEIDSAALIENEVEELISKQKFLVNAEKIISSLSLTYDIIYGGREKTVSDFMAEAAKNLNSVADCANELLAFSQSINDISAQADDLAFEIKAYLDGMEYDARELEQIDERLYLIKTLKKKYGQSISEIFAYRLNITEKISFINSSTENQEMRKLELEKLKTTYESVVAELTIIRKRSAQILERRIIDVLKEMNMQIDFEVRFIPKTGFLALGREEVEFYISTNIGEGFKPLVKIASGGELARLMLAMRTVLNDTDPVPILVFDEVDAGMGGVTLGKVATKIANLAQTAQILCVTHSAQLAAKAQFHYLVNKEEQEGKTFTNVHLLEQYERVNEIARMLDGKITTTSCAHAAELLDIK